MYKKDSSYRGNSVSTGCIDLEGRPKYKPFSYYVKGGIDIDGDALRDGDAVTFDDDEHLAPDCGVDATSDPRTSAFDIAEKAGIEAYERYKREHAEQSAQTTEKAENGDKNE